MLDFDGVINMITPAGYYIQEYVYGQPIVPVLARRVGQMVNDLGASVVISSDWRNQCELSELRQILLQHAQIDPSRVLGTTETKRIRGEEIRSWLLRFNQPVKLAILDDNHTGRFNMDAVRPWFVQTNPQRGVSKANIAAASALLTDGPVWWQPIAKQEELTNLTLA